MQRYELAFIIKRAALLTFAAVFYSVWYSKHWFKIVLFFRSTKDKKRKKSILMNITIDLFKKLQATNTNFKQSSNDTDECGKNSNLCPEESGCHNTNLGYKCICQLDLKPIDPITGCDRNGTRKQNKTEHHPYLLDYNLTTETFDHQLPNAPNILPTNNETSMNNKLLTNQQNGSKSKFVTDRGFEKYYIYYLSHPLLFFVVILIAAFLLCVAIYYKKRLNRSTNVKTRPTNHIPMTGTLSKCMQQYVSNPNYYSSSPDSPFFKLLGDIEISEEKITFEEEIGEGCFGTVFRGTFKQSETTIIPVAIKVLKNKNEALDDFEREIEIISSFNHINIVQLFGIVFKESNSIPYMIFEYMKYGDLAELLRTQIAANNHIFANTTHDFANIDITRDDLIWISTQIANGCKYLSENHFVHRDLATRNCLVGSNLSVKISDFGMSRDIYTCDYYKVGGSRMLPIRWMAPESILYGKFTLESDVWAFGVILWEVYTYGKQPYYGHSNEEVVKLILQGILLIPPEDCPQCIYDLMACCWKTEPRNRITFSHIFNQLLENCSPNKKQLFSANNKIIEQNSFDAANNYLVPNLCSN